MRILCTGDLHIGRRSSRLPADFDGRRFSSAATWESIVDYAIEQRVDLVALSGDLVDRDNRYFEAFGPLERGMERLAQAGIETCAVAGNHDFDVLPRLAEATGGQFRLLGQGGTWERATITRDGQPVLHVDGWSFPEEQVRISPLAGYHSRGATGGVPVLGLLHADLDQSQSRYAPVPLADLQARPVAFWLLGHVHAPALIERPGCPPVLYPGSPQALDPGERDVHGVWLIDLAPGVPVIAQQVSLSTVRYRAITLDLTGVADPDDLRARVASAVRTELGTAAADRPRGLECLSCRVTLTGRTSLHGRIAGLLASAQSDLRLQEGSISAVIEKVNVETRPALDLKRLAATGDAAGEVARLLLALESDHDDHDYRDLIERTVASLRGVHRANAYVDIAGDPVPDESAAREHLRTQGWLLLDRLLSQRGAA